MEKEFNVHSMDEQLVEQFKKELLNFVHSRSCENLSVVLDHQFLSSGKLIRPMMIFELSKILKIDPQITISWAVTCEVLHSATLIHDDLQDGDLVRRGVASIWAKFGKNMAINAGDYLMLLAPHAISNSTLDIETKLKLHELFIKMSTEIVVGQCKEFELNNLNSENIKKDYIECINGKTAALFAGLAKGVGIIAGQTPDNINKISEVFCTLGTIFQIQDDLLDLYGEKQRDGQGNDIKEGKVSYLIATHLENCPQDLFLIKELLFKPRELTSDNDILWIKQLLKESSTFDVCIKDFLSRIEELIESPIFNEFNELKMLVITLLEKVILPIEHILTPQKERIYAQVIQ